MSEMSEPALLVAVVGDMARLSDWYSPPEVTEVINRMGVESAGEAMTVMYYRALSGAMNAIKIAMMTKIGDCSCGECMVRQGFMTAEEQAIIHAPEAYEGNDQGEALTLLEEAYKVYSQVLARLMQ